MSFARVKRAGAFLLATLLGFGAQAATLDAVRGGILVSRGGSPYHTVSQPTQLAVGDSVLANPGGTARVVFADGCAVEIHPGMVFTVPEASPCRAEGPPPESTGLDDSSALAIGAVVVAGGVGIAIAASGGGGGGGGSASP